MLFRKLKEGPVSDSDGATGAHRLVGARPVEHGCGSYFGSVKEKSNRSWGSPSQFPRHLKKLEEISTEPNLHLECW